MGDLEAMTVDYANIELAAKRGNPSLIWRGGQERQPHSTLWVCCARVLREGYAPNGLMLQAVGQK